jgi:hypothetical protein
MTPGNIYRHIDTLDIDMHAGGVEKTEEGYKVVGCLFNRINQTIYEYGIYTIANEDLWKWKVV